MGHMKATCLNTRSTTKAATKLSKQKDTKNEDDGGNNSANSKEKKKPTLKIVK